jgi:cysteinyl-tRNA synthetase
VLRLYDTATGMIRPLEHRDPDRVGMYVCGLTVSGDPHIGHGRLALVFDVLRRYLEFSGLDVHFVSNVTDIDDKIIARAAQEGRNESEIAEQYESEWWAATDALGVLRPTDAPHATSYIDKMVALIGDLVAVGVAYSTPEGVYLAVEDVDGYGLLAGQPLDSLRVGARIEASPHKRSPLDFVLWKPAKPGEPRWPSPWGDGRPGWHTECVAMSLDLLGAGFDVHGGGLDLRFPHHENERAQAVAHGDEFARHWVHNGMALADGVKMSKSLGNFTTLADLLDRYDGRAYRLLVLRSHYRSPIEVREATIRDAQEGLERLDNLARRFSLGAELVDGAPARWDPERADKVDTVAVDRFFERMDDDLDTPAALADIFDLVRSANSLADAGHSAQAARTATTVALLSGALGLAIASSTREIDEETQALVRERDAARAAREWGQADRLRAELSSRGWVVEDGPDGTILRG